MNGNFMFVALAILTGAVTASAAGSNSNILPVLSVRQLESLVAGYHVNKEIDVNYGQTIGQMKKAVAELLSKSGELQQSALEAYDLAKEKVVLVQTENIPQTQIDRFDQRQDKLVNSLSAMAQELNTKLTKIATGLKSIIASRLLFFKENMTASDAYRRLNQLLNYQYYVHGETLKPSSRKQLRRLMNTFAKHRADVFLGQPDNDLTSTAHFNPDNTVFSRHPENLRHNAVAKNDVSDNHNVKAITEATIIEDANKINQNLQAFGAELVKFVVTSTNEFYNKDIPAALADPNTQQFIALAKDIQKTAQNNVAAMNKLVSNNVSSARV